MCYYLRSKSQDGKHNAQQRSRMQQQNRRDYENTHGTRDMTNKQQQQKKK